MAKLIGAEAKEIIFTSGATEANNMAVKVGHLPHMGAMLVFLFLTQRPRVSVAQGVARFYKGKKNHVITTQTEHKVRLRASHARYPRKLPHCLPFPSHLSTRLPTSLSAYWTPAARLSRKASR